MLRSFRNLSNICFFQKTHPHKKNPPENNITWRSKDEPHDIIFFPHKKSIKTSRRGTPATLLSCTQTHCKCAVRKKKGGERWTMPRPARLERRQLLLCYFWGQPSTFFVGYLNDCKVFSNKKRVKCLQRSLRLLARLFECLWGWCCK